MRRRHWVAVGAVVLLAAASLPFVLLDGPILPDGAVRARMYVDWHAARPWPAESAIDEDVSGVVTALNSLRGKTSEGCFLMSRPGYRIRFEYPDGSDGTVTFDLNCASVHSGDAVRYGEVTDVLDAFAERYRTQGGAVPDPPWDW